MTKKRTHPNPADGRKGRGSVKRGAIMASGSRDSSPALADVTTCHKCGRTWISATNDPLSPFPVPYTCWPECRPRLSDGVVSSVETKVSTKQEDQHGTDSA